jgi:dipeptidyl aminopeptidase/acylaminoacyl peptidase/uncharacterized protein (DUF885 family)
MRRSSPAALFARILFLLLATGAWLRGQLARAGDPERPSSAQADVALDVDPADLSPPPEDPWYEPAPQQRLGRGEAGQDLVFKARLIPHWFDHDRRFWYRNDLHGGVREFVVVDAEKGVRAPAFDHQKLAASLSKVSGGKTYPGDHLPFDAIDYVEDLKAVVFQVGETRWRCRLDTYECTKATADVAQKRSAEGQSTEREKSVAGRRQRQRGEPPASLARSPDGKWTAFLKDHNVYLRREGENSEKRLSEDGREGLAYGRLAWAPDSKTLVAFRIEPGDRKPVYLIQSSPAGGGRARMRARPYDLPGDKLDAFELILFDIATKTQKKPKVERIDYDTPRLRWDKDGHRFFYEKVDRGHQRFRVIEVDTHTGTAREIIDEKSASFIWTAHRESVNLQTVNWLEDSPEVLYVSERDGWRHLYLVDTRTGRIKNPVTSGAYVLRAIDRIDEAKRQVTFRASGRNPGQDPYFIQYYRVNFDGTGLVALTEASASHAVQFSPDARYLIDTYSRVDMAPVHELRRASDGKLVCKLEQADISRLLASGWQPPEVLVAKGRDGKTDIWGIICRPTLFDPHKKYPVIEQIYAGPQGSFVPKTFSPGRRFSTFTELGFIVVQMDGMGTANRSKAFHDVCWHNLKDAGLPDRILWHQAAAQKHAYYDISRVGIYGTSAGGQNAAGAALFHPDFYKAAAAACGCHDNRMDKLSWNEQWMGYPVGPWYSESSNIDNAHRLQGKLLLIVGEMDSNVPPESTLRFVDALIKAGKDFELLVVPGANHGTGGAYGLRRMRDFFVRNLMRVEPPDRNGGASRDTTVARLSPGLPVRRDSLASMPAHSAGRPGPLEISDVDDGQSELRGVIERYAVDRGSLLSSLPLPPARRRDERVREFTTEWLSRLGRLEFDPLSRDAQVDYLLFKNHLTHELRQLDIRARAQADSAALVPFAQMIVDLDEARRQLKPADWSQVAASLNQMAKQIEAKRAALQKTPRGAPGATKATANRALATVESLRNMLRAWFAFYDGYDPLFTWWIQEPYKTADQAISAYGSSLQQHFGAVTAGVSAEFGPGGPRQSGRFGRGPGSGFPSAPAPGSAASGTGGATGPDRNREIVGTPIGREALLSELEHEMIAYSPEELVQLAREELRYCEGQMKRAAREMGYNVDWRAALEHVKTLHVEPGKQPALIRDLALEAIQYMDDHELVTVPPLCRQTWRMEMMSPERQLVNPFFLGGEVISVSFPTAAMPHEAKLMSMRGNNIHFARATVFHELIPGHHLQQFMTARYKTYRRLFSTPFWTEGWALYWELLLWDKGFGKTPENRVGMLFWRMHRCARIIFSLGFHLGTMSPQECIDLLVDRIGHERDNATAEVRRSFTSFYGPLYQAAYLLGGLQLRTLHRELVESGKITERAFHDAILKEGNIPIDMVRALLGGRKLSPGYAPDWKFYSPPARKD